MSYTAVGAEILQQQFSGRIHNYARHESSEKETQAKEKTLRALVNLMERRLYTLALYAKVIGRRQSSAAAAASENFREKGESIVIYAERNYRVILRSEVLRSFFFIAGV